MAGSVKATFHRTKFVHWVKNSYWSKTETVFCQKSAHYSFATNSSNELSPLTANTLNHPGQCAMPAVMHGNHVPYCYAELAVFLSGYARLQYSLAPTHEGWPGCVDLSGWLAAPKNFQNRE